MPRQYATVGAVAQIGMKARLRLRIAASMAPFGSVPAGGRRSSIDRPAPDSLPRFEGFGSTLGGFARSPQVSRAHPSLLRRENEPEDFAIPENLTEFALGESLTTPFLTSEAQATAERSQPSRPPSLLARSLGTFNDVFSRQVSLLERTS